MNLAGIYRAKVLANVDTSHLGRIKVEVYPYLIGKETALLVGMEGIDTDNLPWACPAFPLFSGAGTDAGSFCVPDVGSFVFVFFESNDFYQITYFAEAQTNVHGLPSEAVNSADYPFTKVWKTSNNIVIKINDKAGNEYIEIDHPKGTNILINKDGDVTIHSHGEINLQAVSDINVSSIADINIVSTGNVNINP